LVGVSKENTQRLAILMAVDSKKVFIDYNASTKEVKTQIEGRKLEAMASDTILSKSVE
jgi:hypothetical protein